MAAISWKISTLYGSKKSSYPISLIPVFKRSFEWNLIGHELNNVFKTEHLLENNCGNRDWIRTKRRQLANVYTKLWNFLKSVIRLRLGSVRKRRSSKHPLTFERRPTSTPEQIFITLIGNFVCLFMWDSFYLKLQSRDSTPERAKLVFWEKNEHQKYRKIKRALFKTGIYFPNTSGLKDRFCENLNKIDPAVFGFLWAHRMAKLYIQTGNF